MEFRVFIDEPRDPAQKPMLFEIFQMLMQIEIRHTAKLSSFYETIRMKYPIKQGISTSFAPTEVAA
jgi:hypothetical protein